MFIVSRMAAHCRTINCSSTARMGRTTSTSERNRYEGGKDENVKVHVDEIASTPTKEGPSHADQGIQKL
ncbi:hypothetical protein PRIPAC_86800, partial [Pristionchus pacificus]|uniref:Uncharacterized protein n=1 Tax=Pristionchus pacificus TaxID=54126 RepID=A0A2A6BM06_PRIPA